MSDLTGRMGKYAARFDKIGKEGHGDVIRRWAAEVAELETLRSLVTEAWAKMGPTGYFPNLGAPLSDSIRNIVAKQDGSPVKPIDRHALWLAERAAS